MYAKPPLLAVREQVLKYLARYTHRVAISNQRLLSLQDGRVTFRYKDYAADRRSKTMTLTGGVPATFRATRLASRFRQDPRHYGLLAVARGRNDRLALCADACCCCPPQVAGRLSPSSEAAEGVLSEPAREPCCPYCGGTRLSFYELTAEEALRLGSRRGDSS